MLDFAHPIACLEKKEGGAILSAAAADPVLSLEAQLRSLPEAAVRRASKRAHEII